MYKGEHTHDGFDFKHIFTYLCIQFNKNKNKIKQ